MLGFNFLTTRFWIIALIIYFIFFFVYMFLIKIYIKKMLYSYNHMIPGGENNKKMARSAATFCSVFCISIMAISFLISMILENDFTYETIGFSISSLILLNTAVFTKKKSNIRLDGQETEDEYGFYNYTREELKEMDSISIFFNYKLYFNFSNIISYSLSLIPLNILFNLEFNIVIFALLIVIASLTYYPVLSKAKKGDTPLTKNELKYYKDIQKENEKRLNNKKG